VLDDPPRGRRIGAEVLGQARWRIHQMIDGLTVADKMHETLHGI
jgi:hypothetical protein